MDFLNGFLQILADYDGSIGMAATVILAIIILVLVRNVKKNVKEMTQPYVVLYLTKLQTDEAVNYFVLENFGKRAASNVVVSMYPELLIEYPKAYPFPLFFERPISVLAPSQRIMTALPPGDYLDKRYDCTITYRGDRNESYTRKQVMDFAYTKQLLFSISPENKIARSTERISQYLEDILVRLDR